jgi:hypothetical protein
LVLIRDHPRKSAVSFCLPISLAPFASFAVKKDFAFSDHGDDAPMSAITAILCVLRG